MSAGARITEYPFSGQVTHVIQGVGLSKDENVLIYDGVMDIHMQRDEEGRSLQSASYVICMPLKKDQEGNWILPRKGDKVTATRYGESLSFIIDNVEPSQLGGISLYATRQDW